MSSPPGAGGLCCRTSTHENLINAEKRIVCAKPLAHSHPRAPCRYGESLVLLTPMNKEHQKLGVSRYSLVLFYCFSPNCVIFLKLRLRFPRYLGDGVIGKNHAGNRHMMREQTCSLAHR